jgi:phosphate ABC transporter phosphate-binding protein
MSTPVVLGPFLESIVRSGLLSAEMLRPYADLEDPPDAPNANRGLTARLIKDRLLTPFQGRQLLAGRTSGFFLANKYRVLELLGTGGMGHVFLCEHLLLQRLVAVKVLQRAAASGTHGGMGAAVERFLREARAVAALDHPNIVRVFDMERVGNVPFMVMEYVEGASLHQIVTKSGSLTPARAAHYGRQAAAGLQHAHEHGLIHRDIKPGNLLVDRSGTVKILDLGLARFLRDVARNADVTARYDDNKSIVGTADYMSPEQAMNSPTVDIRADIYSLGATLYFLLTGRAPFEAESLTQKLVGHQFRMPAAVQSINPDVPAGLQDIVMRMLVKEPEKRFQTPADVVAALEPLARTIDPSPPAQEMPTMLSSDFRLGLSPASNSMVVGASVGPDVSELPLGLDTAEANADTPRMQPGETGLTPASPVNAQTPTSPVLSDSIVPSIKSRARETVGRGRKAIVLGAGAILVIIIGLFIWWNSIREREAGNPSVKGGGTTGEPPAIARTVTGSGSTFIKPAMDHWAPIYEQKSGVKIKYDGIGSGRGVDNMVDRVLDFGCTDAAMDDAKLAKARERYGDVVHVPLALGAVVATYNLPDLDGQLRFTGSVLADIYLGKIRKWNHEAIRASNPGVALPELEITVVHRSDSSGSTFIWTDYLQKVSPDWTRKVGPAKTVINWPIGEEGEKSDGVVKAVSKKIGAIGYVELSFAIERNLKVGRVKNQEGKYVEPTFESVTAAANASLRTIPADLRFTLTDAPGEDSYPIAGTAWAVLYTNQTGPRGNELVKFLMWIAHDGQGYLTDLKYAPLPTRLVTLIDEKLAAIRTKD